MRLRYAYADTLLAAGRTEEALEWFHRTVGIDGEEITDAAERVAELERADGGPADPAPAPPAAAWAGPDLVHSDGDR